MTEFSASLCFAFKEIQVEICGSLDQEHIFKIRNILADLEKVCFSKQMSIGSNNDQKDKEETYIQKVLSSFPPDIRI